MCMHQFSIQNDMDMFAFVTNACYVLPCAWTTIDEQGYAILVITYEFDNNTGFSTLVLGTYSVASFHFK